MNSSNNQQNYIFTEAQIENFVGFYYALKKVHDRLIREGYRIENGQVIKPKNREAINKR